MAATKTEAPEKTAPASTEELLARMQQKIEEQDQKLDAMRRREEARQLAEQTQSHEGYAAFLDEQNAGAGAATRNRPPAPTQGKGNDLPEAPFYRVTTPWINPQTGQPDYTGITLNLPIYNGSALTPDRDKAWALKTDFGYIVEPVFETTKVVPVELVPLHAPDRAAPGGLGPA